MQMFHYLRTSGKFEKKKGKAEEYGKLQIKNKNLNLHIFSLACVIITYMQDKAEKENKR